MVDGFKLDVHLDLDPVALLKITHKACDDAAKKAVEKVMSDSKQYIKSHAKHPTGKLVISDKCKVSGN